VTYDDIQTGDIQANSWLDVLFLGPSAFWAVDDPVRVKPEEAGQHLTKKVDAVVPQMAKLVGLGGTVVLDAIVSPEGKVTSVKAISGSPILIQSVIETVRQWEYKPFLRDGQAISVITQITWNFPSFELTKSEQVAAREYYPAFQSCYDLVHGQKYAEAKTKCSEAVGLADQLPKPRVLERSNARTFLAHSLLGLHKASESIPLYEQALEIRGATEGANQDADFAWGNANLARAYALVGQFEKADLLYARAITVFESAIVALPQMAERYTHGLKATLLEYAKLKEARGELERVKELEQKAATLQVK